MIEHYTEMDRLVLERWSDVIGLIEAQRVAQDQIEVTLGVAGERILRWVRERGFEGEMSPRDGELWVWRPSWYDKRKAVAKVYFALGGLCPIGFRKVEDSYPYLWVCTYPLEDFKKKESERVKFAQALRVALGDQAREWEDTDIEDANFPLGRHLRQYGSTERIQWLLDPNRLVEFSKEHLPALFALADTIDSELQRIAA